ncbi:MAG: NADH:ubiquinone reductase (Na(+)-transporting) subunit A [Bacteroidales bacterium]|nr:NADH:ubiquinone reductase (Na(+)-transporting) subunit A [Bacteroidales bacterium]
MVEKIKIHKGLDIPLGGAAEPRFADRRDIALYGIMPEDFVGFTPRLEVHEGDHVMCGQPLMSDKNNPRIRLTSPVCGTVKEVRRGERRAITAVVVEKDEVQQPWKCDTESIKTREGLIEAMTDCGLWAMMRQRPFGTIANPNDKPRDIFISFFDTAPLAPCPERAINVSCLERAINVSCPEMANNRQWLAAGLNALAMLTEGMVHVCVSGQWSVVSGQLADNIIFHEVTGPHPAGNIGTQIAAIAPINKGEKVWTMNRQDVATLGRLVTTGEYVPERYVAVTGPAAAHPQYYHITAGASLGELLKGQLSSANYPKLALSSQQLAVSGTRVISGNVLSGRAVGVDGFVGAYDSQVTLIEEGDCYDFMGWLMPGLKKHSFSRTFLSGVLNRSDRNMVTSDQTQVTHHRSLITYKFNTNLHGGERPLVFSGDFERVFPFDIYPTQLIKAAIVGDIELMEKLGIYEVEPEDFSLCEYIDPSKTEIQSIIRGALEKLRNEF